MRNVPPQNLQNRLTASQHRIVGSRRGTMMLWSVWALMALLVIVAGVFNVTWLSCVRTEARRHAESAVIAGGHAYLSDDMLRTYQQPFEIEGRAVRSRNAVVDYFRQASDPSLAAMIGDGDVDLIDSQAETNSGDIGLTQSEATVPNEIRVTYGKSQGNDQVRMFFSGLTNAGNARIGVSATACIEHSPVGFLPGGHVTIPLLPFGIVDHGTADAATVTVGGIWSQLIENCKGCDNFTWHPESHSVVQGPDGLPEITMTLSSNSAGGSADSFVPLKFSALSTTSSSSQAVSWMQHGVSSADLQTLGLNLLSFPCTITTVTFSRPECAEIAAWLQSHTGQSFIVCLCNPAIVAPTSGRSSTSIAESIVSTAQLDRAVAARIIACGVSPKGDVRVVLQPCVLITSTAIMSSSPQAVLNRYVYSVRLSN